ncbi:MAG: ankyrin repeat domain-containing protein, partial [Ekhidna sp.]|nr:ankyrin repeat domain-containing protein [Ekhidna sp.]
VACGDDDSPANKKPEIQNQNFTVAENAANGTAVGTVQAADPKKDDLTFSITSGNDDSNFAINENTGQITVARALDFETASTYTLKISVSDGNLSSTADININVTDVDEEPSSSPCPDAAPTPLITYSSGEKTLFDSMATAIRAKHLPELKRLIACNAARANTTGPTVLQNPVLSWLSSFTDPDFDFSVKAAEVLIDNGADIEKTGWSGYTPLWYATRRNNLPLVKFLVAKGAKQKTEAMISAVFAGHLEVLKFLLSEEADIFARAGAVTENIVKFLVEEDKRLDMHLVGFDGSALTRAARAGHVEVVKYLLDKGVDINQYSKTALQLAAFRGHLAVVEELIRRGADVNKADVHGHTPLMVAVLSRQNGLEIVKALVEQGKADLTKMDRKGKTALALARDRKSRVSESDTIAYIQKMIDYLVSKNAPE